MTIPRDGKTVLFAKNQTLQRLYASKRLFTHGIFSNESMKRTAQDIGYFDGKRVLYTTPKGTNCRAIAYDDTSASINSGDLLRICCGDKTYYTHPWNFTKLKLI